MVNIIKNVKKDSEKKHVKNIKKYQNLFEEEIDERQKKVLERYQNISEEQKHKLLEHMRNYCLPHKR